MSQPAPDARSRDLILDAAERLFAAQGFARTTIKQIGREAGVNSALLYYYFADKHQLYAKSFTASSPELWPEALALVGFALALVVLSVVRFRKTIE
jgi:DNA-binding transcriptional regulator YbjK